ncbi:MAG TPA: non-canonical purine NTP pyrophosphatase, RdgB/HAM1 family [Rhodobiaceae bacterium]|nr:non-canonical purine NTP pyrophosphatase, RdgB/HAM1 family [Rhodobiaceae bacterium]
MTAARRRFEGTEIIVASHNVGKISEIGDLLAPFGVASVGADALGLDEPEETGADFIANAELKAHAAAIATGRPALADDSGLAVDALDGAPGIYSARWAQTPDGIRDFAFAMQKVETALAQKPDAPRTARFICALSLAWPDGHAESFEGQVAGTLVWPMRGDNGFGYDPVFLPLGGDLTFGEMSPQAKHAISHRADAFAQLVAGCFGG